MNGQNSWSKITLLSEKYVYNLSLIFRLKAWQTKARGETPGIAATPSPAASEMLIMEPDIYHAANGTKWLLYRNLSGMVFLTGFR